MLDCTLFIYLSDIGSPSSGLRRIAITDTYSLRAWDNTPPWSPYASVSRMNVVALTPYARAWHMRHVMFLLKMALTPRCLRVLPTKTICWTYCSARLSAKVSWSTCDRVLGGMCALTPTTREGAFLGLGLADRHAIRDHGAVGSPPAGMLSTTPASAD